VGAGIIKERDLTRNKKEKENCRKVEDIGDFSSIDPPSASIVFHFMWLMAEKSPDLFFFPTIFSF
jgi:hypothetical protein